MQQSPGANIALEASDSLCLFLTVPVVLAASVPAHLELLPAYPAIFVPRLDQMIVDRFVTLIPVHRNLPAGSGISFVAEMPHHLKERIDPGPPYSADFRRQHKTLHFANQTFVLASRLLPYPHLPDYSLPPIDFAQN